MCVVSKSLKLTPVENIWLHLAHVMVVGLDVMHAMFLGDVFLRSCSK